LSDSRFRPTPQLSELLNLITLWK